MARSRSSGSREGARRGPRARFAALIGIVAILALAMSSLGGGAVPAPTVASPGAGGATDVRPPQTAEPQDIEVLLSSVRQEYWTIYDADRTAATDDDLTSTKLDLILTGAASPDAAATVQLLGQLTTTILNLTSAAIGNPTDGDPICAAGLVDVTGVQGATALFGDANPSIATVVAKHIGTWNGRLTNDGRAWSFRFTQAEADVALAVLVGINEGRLITSSGC